jgi:tetratricopeptide (TPR) repeat protein
MKDDMLLSRHSLACRHSPALRPFCRSFVCGAIAVQIALLSTGCASLRRHTLDTNLVAARQMALRGMDAVQRGQLTDAEMLFSRAVQMCPLDERMQCHYADTLWQLGNRDQAVNHMEEAVRLSGGNPELVVRLGDMYLACGAVARAAEQAELALLAQRQLASAWALKGDTLRAQQRFEEGLASYHRALSYQEHFPRVQLAVAETYREQGRPTRALATLRTLADGYPSGEVPQHVLFLQGVTLKELGRQDAAVERLIAAAKQGDASPELWYHLAEAHYLAGDPANARLAVQAALAQAPQHGPSQALRDQLEALQRRLAARMDR